MDGGRGFTLSAPCGKTRLPQRHLDRAGHSQGQYPVLRQRPCTAARTAPENAGTRRLFLPVRVPATLCQRHAAFRPHPGAADAEPRTPRVLPFTAAAIHPCQQCAANSRHALCDPGRSVAASVNANPACPAAPVPEKGTGLAAFPQRAVPEDLHSSLRPSLTESPMCGIAGFVRFQHPTGDIDTLKAMGNAIFHRGPDAGGEYIDDGVGLCHRRLAIIDLSPAGVQPMHSVNDRYVIVFNGEIYNFQELREDLIAKGYQFRSRSDTEVLLALYQHEGETLVEKINGMFTFALWDKQEQVLFI